ncbi:hypothetical protein U1Q18_040314 [Sarracenia purpurea var. burkii]
MYRLTMIRRKDEIDILDLKRNSVVRDISLAQKDLQYIDEVRKQRSVSSPKETMADMNVPPRDKSVKVGKGKAVVAGETCESSFLEVPSSSNLKVCEVIEKTPDTNQEVIIPESQVQEGTNEANPALAPHVSDTKYDSEDSQGPITLGTHPDIPSDTEQRQDILKNPQVSESESDGDVILLEAFPPLSRSASPRSKEPPDRNLSNSKKKKKKVSSA